MEPLATELMITKQNPYLFIVGSPRSGTTLLKRMLNAHPELAITRETHWITRYYKTGKGLTHDKKVTEALIPKLFEYHRLPHLGLEADALKGIVSKNKTMSYADFVSAVFDLYGQRQNKSLVGDKTPGYVRNIPLLHKLWPHSKFIHMIRDGREVCLSMQKWRLTEKTLNKYASWNDDTLSTIALWWKWHVQLGTEAGQKLTPSNYYEIKYEQLIDNPGQSCNELCDYLGLEYHENLINFANGKTNVQTGSSANASWLPPTKGLRNWKAEMSATDCERVEAVIGNFLEELGFDRAYSTISEKNKEHALKVFEKFTQYMLDSGKRLPIDWKI